ECSRGDALVSDLVRRRGKAGAGWGQRIARSDHRLNALAPAFLLRLSVAGQILWSANPAVEPRYCAFFFTPTAFGDGGVAGAGCCQWDATGCAGVAPIAGLGVGNWASQNRARCRSMIRSYSPVSRSFARELFI